MENPALQPQPAPQPWPRDKERRKHPRRECRDVKIACTSAEFAEKRDAHNFARELLNVSEGGMAIVATGKLRTGVELSVKVEAEGGRLLADAMVVWSQVVKQGMYDFCLAGLRFTKPPVMSGAIREIVTGEKVNVGPSRTLLERVRELRTDPGTVPVAGGGGWVWKRRFQRIAICALVLLVLYVGSFWGFVVAGRVEGEGIRFRFPRGAPHGTLEAAYGPVYGLFRAVGVPLHYLGPE